MRVTPSAVNSPVSTGWVHEVGHVGLGGEVVDLVGPGLLQHHGERVLVEQVGRDDR